MPEDDEHAFILRIWYEPREIEGARPQWRGRIQHVITGQQRYLKDLQEIVDFLEPYIFDTDQTVEQIQQLIETLRTQVKRGD
jgi:hypothetical protein